ncbi:ATP-dependent DNA ligase [Neochlamydia sp. AcF95]|uniref:ATP-dependent DNA ligase n=1 Tax=Neochlamydia sp. AcF95 TaxID=2795734 RepID=UPI001BCA060E|nr:ATP-dependent DNA ligase [Neochlamydia sp. AcF95]
MKNFTELFDLIDQTSSTNEKLRYMEEYFKKVPSEDGAWALFFLSGHRLKRLIGSKTLLTWCGEITQLPAWLIEESYASVGDTAETISLLLEQSYSKNHLIDLPLSAWMANLILPLKSKKEEEQKSTVVEIWKSLSKKEIFIFNKILTGGFRIGVSQLSAIKAVSQALEVPKEVLSQRVMGHWQPTANFFDSLRVVEEKNNYLNPYPFYLASPLEGNLEALSHPHEWQAEWKWDGIRAQVVFREKAAAIWSRGNELISDQFPEILEGIQKFPHGTVLDGEILAYENETPLSFGILQKRLGRKAPSKAIQKEAPVVFMIYDLLEYNGVDLRKEALINRRKILEELAEIHPKFLISPLIAFNAWEQIHEKRLMAKHTLTEGIMLKRLNSPYGTGRQRGNWWKYKIDPMTIDAVLLYAQAGTGRRANLYTDYTFGVWHQQELIPITKAYSGLSQQEIDKLDRWIRRNTEEKFGPVRKVKAEQVFEIAFEGIQSSKRHKSGIALRFPRIARWRTDKPFTECDTLQQIKLEFLNEQ